MRTRCQRREAPARQGGHEAANALIAKYLDGRSPSVVGENRSSSNRGGITDCASEHTANRVSNAIPNGGLSVWRDAPRQRVFDTSGRLPSAQACVSKCSARERRYNTCWRLHLHGLHASFRQLWHGSWSTLPRHGCKTPSPGGLEWELLRNRCSCGWWSWWALSRVTVFSRQRHRRGSM